LKTIVIKAGSAKKVLANADFNSGAKSLSNYTNLESFTIEKPNDPAFLSWNGGKLANNAFKGLANLKVVKIGIDTSNIGSSAFEGCTSLETAEFGLTRTLSPGAFKDNVSLKSLIFNKTYLPIAFDEFPPEPGNWFSDVDTSQLTIYVPTVAVNVFQDDEDWSNICDGCSIMSNGDDAEKDADAGPAATQNVVIETFTTKKLNEAIDSSPTGKNYGDIKTLTIKGGTIDPADTTFIAANLKKLEELYIIGSANFVNGIIPKNAFEGNRYLTKVRAENVKEIGVKAFNLFESLTEVDFPDVTIIRSQAFAQTKGSSASKLKTARFPKVQVIEQRAFYFCVNLEKLYLGDIPPTLNVPEGKQGLWFNFVTDMTVYVESLAVYEEYIKLENSDQIDWSALNFVATNGDELPIIPAADPYVDADYDHLRVDQTVPYYNGDYGLSLNMYTFNMNLNSWIQGRNSPVPMTTLEAIEWAHDNGFDAVDITCYYLPGYSNTAMPTADQQAAILAYAKEIKEYSAELGIAISGTGMQNNFADPNEARRNLDIERVKFYIQVAAEMGAPVIRVFTGPPPVDIKRTGWAAIMKDRITPAIQEVADFAAENYPTVHIGVQNHGDMLATANQVLQLIQWVDRDNVGVVNDTGYYRDFMNLDARGYHWYEDISLILPYSNNFQVKKKPGGAETTELMDLEKIFTSIRSSSYHGYVPVELLWNPGDVGYPGDLSTPPYEETLAFLEMMRTAMNNTKQVELSAMTLSSGALSPAFDSGTTAYTSSVANSVSSLTVTSSVENSNATIKVNGDLVVSGQASSAINLNVGSNTITIVVTTQNGITKTYTITVNRAPADESSTPSGSSGTPTNDTVVSTDGKLTLPTGKSGKVSLEDAVTIAIPTGATDQELKITIEQVLDTQSLLTNNEVLASPIYEILKNFLDNFNKPVTLSFVFDPAKVNSNQRAAIFYYDEIKKTWVEIAGSKISGNNISVEVNHFTKYAVLVVDQPTDNATKINFSDVSGHWAEASIKQAVSEGIIKGYSDGTFKPNHNVTRAEFTVMLMNAMKPQDADTALTFTDSAKIGAWAQKAIAQAVQAGIIKGYSDGTFRPNAVITRAEMAVMLANALGQSGGKDAIAGFADDKDIPAWAKGSVAFVKQANIVQGKGNNKFAPQDQASRAEAVTVLLKLLAQQSK